MGNFWDFCRTTHQARPPRAGSRCFDSAAFNSTLFKGSGAATGCTGSGTGTETVCTGCGTTGSAGPTEHPRSANVPRVLGQPVAQANTTLTRAGFAVQVAIVRGHPPRNAVVAQDPDHTGDVRRPSVRCPRLQCRQCQGGRGTGVLQ